MTVDDIARRRLARHHLVGEPLPTAEGVVGHLVAVQAQDYAGAKWGVAQRMADTTDAALDALLDAGAILRTHLLRPTWHLVLPADIHWLLALTARRVHQVNGTMYRKCGLDESTLARGGAVIAAAVRDGNHLTRPELAHCLAEAGLVADGFRLAYLIMHAELEGLICSGPRRGKQHTYALLDERAPATPLMPREEALAELARRYLAGRAPATAHDLAAWSGLTVTDARTGLASLGLAAVQETIDGTVWWTPTDDPPHLTSDPGHRTADAPVHLLPNYDEYVASHRDATPILSPEIRTALDAAPTALDAHLIAVDGRLVGGWRRQVVGRAVVVAPTLLRPLTEPERVALGGQVARYARFLETPVSCSDLDAV